MAEADVMGHWHYRIVRDGEALLLAQVHFDENGSPTGYTVDGATFGCIEAEEGRAGIVASLELALRDAKERAILDVNAFPQRPDRLEEGQQ
jgi:hypothetical protein